MKTENEKPIVTHNSTRILYQVQVRRRANTNPDILLNNKGVDTEWRRANLPPRGYIFTDYRDTAAELSDGLFPYALAMKEAWGIMAAEHARAFEVRLVPHKVETSYATYAQEPLPELEWEAP